jgi:hypothetical protein
MSVILPSVFKDGTASVANGSTAVTGASLIWTQNVLPGDFFGVHKGYAIRIASVDDDTHLTLANPWPGATQTAAAYEIMLQSDNARVQETTRQLLERMQSGNLYALAGLAGTTDTLPIFTGPGAFGLISKSDLVAGVNYNVQVPNMAGRATYDANAQGFSVLVSDVGDGRAALYTKKSNTVADWSNPAYITGPVGPMPTVNVGTTSTLAAGANATVARNVVTGGYTFDFGIPRGRGFTNKGTYSAGTAYVLDDGVLYNGSSWICLAATTGNAPPNLPTTSNTWWQLVAIKGTDGTGIGDMVKSTYDPTNINASAFVRGNFTGDQPDSMLMANAAAPTKKAKFDLSGITAGQQRNIRIPDMDTATGIWEPIFNGSISSVVQFTQANLSAFRDIRLTVDLGVETSSLINMQLSADNGATFLAGATDYYRQLIAGNGSAAPTSGLSQSSAWLLSDGQNIAGATPSSGTIGLAAVIHIFGLNSARFKRFKGSMMYQVTSGSLFDVESGGAYIQSTVINAFRIVTATTMSGTIRVEGVRG